MAAPPASSDPYFIETVPQYYDFSKDHDNTLGDRFFDVQDQHNFNFDSSPVAYEKVRTPLSEVKHGENTQHRANDNGGNRRSRRFSKPNMIEQFNKEMQKRRSIPNAEAAPAGARLHARSSSTEPAKNASEAPPSARNSAAMSVFKPKGKGLNPAVVGTVGIKTIAKMSDDFATTFAGILPSDVQQPMQLRPKRSGILPMPSGGKESMGPPPVPVAQNRKLAVGGKNTTEVKQQHAKATSTPSSVSSIFKPRGSTGTKTLASQPQAGHSVTPRNSTLGDEKKPSLGVPPMAKAGETKLFKPASAFSVFARKPIKKKEVAPINPMTMRLRSATKGAAKKDKLDQSVNDQGDNASIKSSGTTDSKGRRLSNYMAPTIASRRRSQIGVAKGSTQ